jgi:hypothetical protein
MVHALINPFTNSLFWKILSVLCAKIKAKKSQRMRSLWIVWILPSTIQNFCCEIFLLPP